jgi:hypothetical protein
VNAVVLPREKHLILLENKELRSVKGAFHFFEQTEDHDFPFEENRGL